MRWPLVRLTAVAAVGLMVVLVASSLLAQGPQQGPPRGGRGMMGPGMGGGMQMGGMGLMGLLRAEQVQKELGLTEDQISQIQDLRPRRGGGRPEAGERGQRGERGERADRGQRGERGERPDFRNMSEEEQREAFEKMRKQFEEEAAQRNKEMLESLGKILKPEQLKRLKQIELQVQGVLALRRPEVKKHLGITEAQEEQFQDLERKAREEMQKAMQEARDQETLDWAQIRQRGEELRKKAEQEVMGVLTADQKATLEEMKGEPFELDRSALRPRGGEGRRGEGRQGDGPREGRPRRGEGRGTPRAQTQI